MNRQITGTLALLTTLVVTQLVSAQLQTPYGPVAMPTMPNQPPRFAGMAPGAGGPQGMPPGMMGQPGTQMMNPAMAGMPPAMMQQAMAQQAMMRQAMAQQAMSPPGMAMQAPMPGPIPGQPMMPGMNPQFRGQPGMGQPGMGQPGMGQPGMGQPGMGQPGMGQPGMGYPPGYQVQQAMFAGQGGLPPSQAFNTACDSSCDGCDSPGCRGKQLFGKLGNGGGCGLFGGGCNDGCCGGGLSNLLTMCKSCGLAGCDHGCDGTGGRCLPRWFDVQAEWLYWQRDFNESLALSSDGILGSIALSTDEIDFEEQSGYRVTYSHIVGPSTGLELSYFGGFNWQNSAIATSDNNLFSVFSDFGTDPINGFPETAFGYLHTVAISSEMNNAEMNLRRRFVSASCNIHSSLLLGVRYFRLRDDMVYETFTDLGEMSYQLKADNDLVGLQTGGDFYLCLTPRFKIGAEIKAGVYGANSKQRTNVFCTSCEPLRERESVSDAAFLGDGGVIGLYRITPRLTLRGGYQVLYVDGIATAVNNFNTESPFTARESFVDNGGDVVVHGTNLGLEWTW